jgi:hypothetical protein
MTNGSATLTSGTAVVLLTGSYVLNNISFTAAAAGSVALRDASTTSLTQSNPAYSNYTVTNPYTRCIYNQEDIIGNLNDYTFTGVGSAPSTVAADASAAIPAFSTIALGAAGTQIDINRYLVTRGLMAKSTVNGTLNYSYTFAR